MKKQPTEGKGSEPVPDFRQIYQLAERYSEAAELLEEHAKGEAYGCSGPHTLVDSFAVELYLKCLHVLDNNEAPPRRGGDGHDWKKLFDGLKPHTRNLLRDTFNETIRKDPVLRNLPFVNPDAPQGLTDFDESLKVAARTFGERRYLYEVARKEKWFYADLIRNTMRTVARMDLRLHEG